MAKKVKNSKRILVLGGGIYARPFNVHGNILLSTNNKLSSLLDWGTIKLVVFTGGHDVSPELYNEIRHKTTLTNSRRDDLERGFFDECVREGIPMVGICRGSQFLTVMNGGKLLQNVDNHAIIGTHPIITNGGTTIDVTSTHHQMMLPRGDYDILAWSDNLSDKYENGYGVISPNPKTSFKEPEVVYYAKTKCLAVQYHPEYMNEDTEGYRYFQRLIKEYSL